jgi:hypothetical protein
MASRRVIQAAVDTDTADLVHQELLNFVQNHSLGAVEKGQDKIPYFDTQLERAAPELQGTSTEVDGFLSIRSRRSSLLISCSSGPTKNI